MKLAILSGTFNPIHKAHLSIANYVMEEFSYDKILVIPASNPPLKENLISPLARLEMVKLALKNQKQLILSEIEFESCEKSYSYITVKKLYERYNIEGKLGFIMGTDAYVGLKKWYEAAKLKSLVDFIVFEREISFSDEKVSVLQDEGFNLIRAELPFKNISSTDIRNKVKNFEDISDYVPKEVEDYINENGLYR